MGDEETEPNPGRSLMKHTVPWGPLAWCGSLMLLCLVVTLGIEQVANGNYIKGFGSTTTAATATTVTDNGTSPASSMSWNGTDVSTAEVTTGNKAVAAAVKKHGHHRTVPRVKPGRTVTKRRSLPVPSALSRPLICLLTSTVANVDQIPGGHCTHLVYLGFRHNVSTNAFVPKRHDVFVGFQALALTMKLFIGIQWPPLELFVQRVHYIREFVKACAYWIPMHGLHGVAFVQYHRGLKRLRILARVIQVISHTLQRRGLEIIFGVTVHYARNNMVETSVLKGISRFVNYLILETHYHSLNESCKTTCPTVYDDRRSLTTLVPIRTAVRWIQNVSGIKAPAASICFSVSLSSHWFIVQDASPKISAPCMRHEQAPYKTICTPQNNWQTEPDLDGSLCDYQWTTARIVSYDSTALLAVKVQKAMEEYSATPCVAVYNVDFDDFDGSCPNGTPFKRLQAVRRAQLAAAVPRDLAPFTRPSPTSAGVMPIGRKHDEGHQGHDGTKARRCVPPGKEDRRPLICIVYQKPDRENAIPRDTCTHIVYAFGGNLSPMSILDIQPDHLQDMVDAEYHLFLAVDQSVLKIKNVGSYSYSSAQQLSNLGANGLAILDVSLISPTLHTNELLKQLRSEFQAEDLCLLMSVDLFDSAQKEEVILNNVKYILPFLDFLVFKTHYGGDAGICSITPVSTYESLHDSCILLTSFRTALGWMKTSSQFSVGSLPQMCLSVDMRVAHYAVCKRLVLNAPCIDEQSLEYSSVCGKDKDLSDVPVEDLRYTSLKAGNGTVTSYEEARLLQNKIRLIRDEFNDLCVVAVNVDLDDPQGRCAPGRSRFRRVEAIRHALDENVQAQEAGNCEMESPDFASPSVETRPQEGKRTKYVLGDQKARVVSYDAHLSRQEDCCRGNGRPFVCFLHIFWKYGIGHILQQPCTHIVVEIYSEGYLELSDYLDMIAALAELRKAISSDSKTRRQLLSRVKGFPLVVPLARKQDALAAFAKRLNESFNKHDLDGVALVDVIGNSFFMQTLWNDILKLRSLLPLNKTLIIGLQVTDSYVDPAVMASRLSAVLRVADIVIFMTHFRQYWSFCRTSAPSVFASQKTCQAVMPLTTVVKWMKAVERLRFQEGGIAARVPPMCLSFTLAVLRFHFVGQPIHGAACDTAVEHVDYDEICDSNRAGHLDPVYNTTYYRFRDNVWDSYEEETFLASTVGRLVSEYPRLCLASFYTESDFNSKSCSVTYPRITRMAQSGGYMTFENATTETPGNWTNSSSFEEHARPYREAELGQVPAASLVSSTMPAEVNEPTGHKKSSNSLVCVVLATGDGREAYPDTGCTHIVLVDVENRGRDISPSREPSWEAFLKAKTSLSPFGLKFLVYVDASANLDAWKAPDALELFLKDSVPWLLNNGLHGYAFLGIKVTMVQFAEVGKVVQAVHDSFLEHGLILVVGLVLQDYDPDMSGATEELLGVISNADVVIFETHVSDLAPPCKFVFPSVLEEGANTSTPILTAVSWMKLFENTRTELCFSLGLQVFRYALLNNGTDDCSQRSFGFYDEVCSGTERRGEILDKRVQSTYQINDSFSTTYDTEENIKAKVTAALEKSPSSCVAAYAVNYDAKDCQNKPFPRLSAITDILHLYMSSALVTTGGTRSTVQDTVPSDSAEENKRVILVEAGGEIPEIPSAVTPNATGLTRKNNSLVCILSDGFEARDQYPKDYCDYFVFMDVVYEEEKATFAARLDDEESFKTFVGMQTVATAPLLAALNEAEMLDVYVSQWSNGSFADAFTTAALRWLHDLGLHGLAFVDNYIGAEDLDAIVTMLEALKMAFAKEDPSLLLMFGAHISGIEDLLDLEATPLQHIAKVVDVMIFETHHARILRQCRVVPPSPYTALHSPDKVLPVKAGISIAKSLRRSVRSGPPATLCVSVSMAALKFTFTDEIPSYGGLCTKEEWTSYDEVCNLRKTARSEDGVFLVHNNKVLSFETEQTLRRKVKDATSEDPSICLAAYYIDLEDNSGACNAHRIPYRRLEAIRKSLDS